MLNKNEIKYIQSLALKKNRDTEKAFIAEGPKIVEELLVLIPGNFQKLYGLEAWIKNNESLTKNVSVQIITEGELERMSQLQTPNQVLAVLKQPEPQRPSGFSWALYLDGIQDPGNMGTIIRTADWFGIQHIVCSPGCADVYNSKVVQSTMASITRVNVFTDREEDWLEQQELPIFAAALDGAPAVKLSGEKKGILIIGNESKGIREEVLQYATGKVTIPGKGKAESLNAAVAAGILLSYISNGNE